MAVSDHISDVVTISALTANTHLKRTCAVIQVGWRASPDDPSQVGQLVSD
jgi:hypothetical protein